MTACYEQRRVVRYDEPRAGYFKSNDLLSHGKKTPVFVRVFTVAYQHLIEYKRMCVKVEFYPALNKTRN